MGRTFAAALVVATLLVQACGGGDGGTAPVTVAAVEITPTTVSVVESSTSQLVAVVKGSDGSVLTDRVVTWSSSNTSTATVSETGLVTGVAPGNAAISAATAGKQATANVTVTISPCNVEAAVPIVSGVPVNGTLAATDCAFGDDTYLDAYKFVLTASTTLDVLLRSTAFDAYLFIYSLTPEDELVKTAEDDNTGGGTDARLTGTLTAGTHFILANSRLPAFGAYTLTFTSPYPGAPITGAAATEAAPTAFNLQPYVKPASVTTPLRRVTPAESRMLRNLVRKPN